MSNHSCSSLNFLFNSIKHSNFSSLLNEDIVSDVISELGIEFRHRIFTPFVTLYAFISQALEDDGSCRKAVAKVMLQRVITHREACSADSGGYCKARDRLPVEFFKAISKRLFSSINFICEKKWQWKHGVVKVVDGTGFTVADTSKNLSKFYRQNSKNKKHPDSGYPIGRLLGVFCLATGGLIDLEISGWKGKGSGELTLIHALWHCFSRGDTLLADSPFSSYFVVAGALSRGVHVVAEFPKKQIARINKKLVDQTITIEKGAKPNLMSKNEYDKVQEKIRVRIIKLVCAPNGFRPKIKWILTTHINMEQIPPNDISELYGQRWQVELNFRSIKTILRMEHISGKSPSMVEKQLWVHMIAYNILRARIAEAGKLGRRRPRELSFRAAQQIVVELLTHRQTEGADAIISFFILSNIVCARPERYEPRAIKRRSKNFALLREPRSVARQRLFKKRKEKKPIP